MCREAHTPLSYTLGFGSVRVIDDQSITRLTHVCRCSPTVCAPVCACVRLCAPVCVCANALTRSHTHLREGLWGFGRCFGGKNGSTWVGVRTLDLPDGSQGL